MRGGEKVLLSLARLFPEAPIYTLLHVPGSITGELATREIHTSFVQHLPGAFRRYRYYLPLFPAAIASFDLRAYDLVISSSHCVAKGARSSPSATHVCYCHTPMRYVWDRYDDYFGPEHMSAPLRWIMPPVARALRAWDVRSARRVDHFAANSHYVAGRIERYYDRLARVIPPPVDDVYFTPGKMPPGEYDLVVSALVPYKRIELILAAYRDSGRRLLIAGGGSEEQRLRSLAPSEVTFVGRVSDAELRRLYQGCRAVVAAAVEDFGIVPLEAMACGRPAVVFAEGGGPETVTAGETGLIFRESTPQSLREVIDSLRHVRFNVDVLRQRAQAYGTAVFESKLRGFVDAAFAGRTGESTLTSENEG
jgi:glycosyltransferase involved in cell wall biosynthesis